MALKTELSGEATRPEAVRSAYTKLLVVLSGMLYLVSVSVQLVIRSTTSTLFARLQARGA